MNNHVYNVTSDLVQEMPFGINTCVDPRSIGLGLPLGEGKSLKLVSGPAGNSWMY